MAINGLYIQHFGKGMCVLTFFTIYQAELKVLIANNNEESEKMKGQVVTSPEKFLGVRNIETYG